MTRADLAQLIADKLGVSTASRSRDAVVPPAVVIEPGSREPLTICWATQATMRVIAGRRDDLDVFEVYDELLDGLVDLLTKARGVSIVGAIPAPTTEALGYVDQWTTTITVRLATEDP